MSSYRAGKHTATGPERTNCKATLSQDHECRFLCDLCLVDIQEHPALIQTLRSIQISFVTCTRSWALGSCARFPVDSSSAAMTTYLRAIFPYSAEAADELTFADGDVMLLVSQEASEEGWWVAVPVVSTHLLSNSVRISMENVASSLPTMSNTFMWMRLVRRARVLSD